MVKLRKWLLIGMALVGIAITASGLLELTKANLGFYASSKQFDSNLKSVDIIMANAKKNGMTIYPDTFEKVSETSYQGLMKYNKLQAIKKIIIGISMVIAAVIIKILF